MTEREKIIKIVQPYISAWGADESLADALIENGYGNVAEWKRRAEVAERAGKIAASKVFDYTYEEAVAQAEKELAEESKNDKS